MGKRTMSASSSSRERTAKAQDRRGSGGGEEKGSISLSLQLPPLGQRASMPSQSSGSNCSSHRSAHNDDCYLSPKNRNGGNAFSSMGEKCVCFICTCGKHHCPPAYRPNATPLDATTHYSQTYKAHDHGCYPERVVVSQSYVGTRAAPGHFDTTHKANYLAPEPAQTVQVFAERMERSRPHNQRTSPRESFNHTTVQRTDYPWHTPSPAVPIRPSAESPISAGPFYGNSTSKDTYVGWKPDPDAFQRSSHSTRNSSHSPFANEPSDFGTSYGHMYVEHAIAQRAPPKPKAAYDYGSPRSFNTSHQLDFSGKQNPVCPAHLLPARPASARSGHVKYKLDTTGTWA